MPATSKIKAIVSKKKRRFEFGSFDLDLSYILTNIIAMGYPSEKLEALYRNKLSDVKEFLDTVHPRNYAVINLCIERKYPPSKFGGQPVLCFEFADHCAPPFKLIHQFCTAVGTYLDANPQAVAAIHCKAGKGRTGTMISCYLLYSGYCRTANEAERVFGNKRTHDGKGVTIPSQKRYIKYYERALNNPKFDPETIYMAPRPVMSLKRVVMHGIPSFSTIPGTKGCDPCLGISVFSQSSTRTVYFARATIVDGDKALVIFDVEKFPLFQDVNFVFFHRNSKTKMCSVALNMMFVADELAAKPEKGYKLEFKRRDIDKACKDKEYRHFARDFSLDFEFVVLNESVPVSAAYGVTSGEQADKNVEAGSTAAAAAATTAACAACAKAIYQSDAVLSLKDKNFHWRCLACSLCATTVEDVNDLVIGEAGSPICSRCVASAAPGVPTFATDFLQICEHCTHAINDDYYQAFAGALYHDGCFVCSVCDRSLLGADAPDKLGAGRLKCNECPLPSDPTGQQGYLATVREAVRSVQTECAATEDLLGSAKVGAVRRAIASVVEAVGVLRRECAAATKDAAASGDEAPVVEANKRATAMSAGLQPLAVSSKKYLAARQAAEDAGGATDGGAASAADAEACVREALQLVAAQADGVLRAASGGQLEGDVEDDSAVSDEAIAALLARAEALEVAEAADAARGSDGEVAVDDPLAPSCSACGRSVAVADVVFAAGQPWHAACMTCSSCNKQFGPDDRYLLAGDLLSCEACERAALIRRAVCAGCSEPVTGAYTELDDGLRYHPTCFTCSSCSTPLGGAQYGELAGDVFCGPCLDSYLPRCDVCRKTISGEMRLRALGGTFHPACFSCTGCKASLASGQYYPVDGKPYCESCAEAL